MLPKGRAPSVPAVDMRDHVNAMDLVRRYFTSRMKKCFTVLMIAEI